MARWPGSTHDSPIFNASYLHAQCGTGELGHGYLLGDCAYPCRSFLMTPVLKPRTEAECRYDEAHIYTRNSVEIWKRRFPSLALGMRTSVETTIAVVVATSLLQDIALNKGDGY